MNWGPDDARAVAWLKSCELAELRAALEEVTRATVAPLERRRGGCCNPGPPSRVARIMRVLEAVRTRGYADRWWADDAERTPFVALRQLERARNMGRVSLRTLRAMLIARGLLEESCPHCGRPYWPAGDGERNDG